MLRLLTKARNKDKNSFGESFNVFNILENVFLKTDINSLQPSDKVWIELYRFKYNIDDVDTQYINDLITRTIKVGTFKTYKGAIEAYIYSYILLYNTNINRFDDLEVLTERFLKQIENIDPVLWDDALGLALGLTINFQKKFETRINELIKMSNQIFKLNFYFGKRIRDEWDKLGKNTQLYKEAVDISNQVFLLKEFSAGRKIPALCFLDSIEYKEKLTKEVMAEIMKPDFYANLFGFVVSEELLDPSYYNYRSPLLFKLLVTFRLLEWNDLKMVPPELIEQANRLRKIDGNPIVMSQKYHICEILGYTTLTILSSYFFFYVVLVEGLYFSPLYVVPIIIALAIDFFHKKRKELRSRGEIDD